MKKTEKYLPSSFYKFPVLCLLFSIPLLQPLWIPQMCCATLFITGKTPFCLWKSAKPLCERIVIKQLIKIVRPLAVRLRIFGTKYWHKLNVVNFDIAFEKLRQIIKWNFKRLHISNFWLAMVSTNIVGLECLLLWQKKNLFQLFLNFLFVQCVLFV